MFSYFGDFTSSVGYPVMPLRLCNWQEIILSQHPLPFAKGSHVIMKLIQFEILENNLSTSDISDFCSEAKLKPPTRYWWEKADFSSSSIS